ncbi:MAG: hypothetical protein RLZZ141_2100, partial [Pseudomonadota bacterium]
MFGKRPLSADDAPSPPAGSGTSKGEAPLSEQGSHPASQGLATPSKLASPHPTALEATAAKMRAETDRLKAQSGAKALSLSIGTAATDPASTERAQYYQATKSLIFSTLITTIDLPELAQMSATVAADEIREIVAELVVLKNVTLSSAEQDALVQDIINDVLGYGPLEPLLMRDDIADIMVNGANRVFIEVNGKVQLTTIRFRDNAQLMNICQRIVSQVGRRVDESSPICDARLPDGSRVNVIAPPLAIDGPTLTIRKFKKDKLTMRNLVDFKSISPDGARVLKVISACRCNILISGGTGSGKTTLLNSLTYFI